MKKNIKPIILIVILGTILSCLGNYLILPLHIRWMINSVVEVPICTARVADKLGIKHDYGVVKRYIIESLKPGMTQDEVEETLGKIGPIEAVPTVVNERHEAIGQILIQLCSNPLGNVSLLVVYSEDGHLIEALDAFED